MECLFVCLFWNQISTIKLKELYGRRGGKKLKANDSSCRHNRLIQIYQRLWQHTQGLHVSFLFLNFYSGLGFLSSSYNLSWLLWGLLKKQSLQVIPCAFFFSEEVTDTLWSEDKHYLCPNDQRQTVFHSQIVHPSWDGSVWLLPWMLRTDG